MKNISVIVTNWNGIELLKKHFQNVINTSPEASEIIFADDASEDSSLAYISELQKKEPRIRILAHSQNLGFGKNSNHAVQTAKGKYIVMLNSDISPHPGYISQSIVHFNKPDVYGVGFSELGHENWGKLKWQGGYLQHEPGENIKTTHISGWVSGGSAVIDKEKFLKLGGFDDVYAPFYWEDLDIGYRAWKSGYQLLWEPKSIVEHKHESTMSKFPRSFSNYVKERNHLLTIKRNITDDQMLFENRLAQIGRVLSGPNYIKIIIAVKKQLKKFPPPIVFPKLTDRDIFAKFI